MKKKQSGTSKRIGVGTAIATAIAGATLWLSAGKGTPIPVPAYEVARVIDGDTFETKEKQIIRLSSIDAPELDRCWGQEAKSALEKLVMRKPVYLKVQFRENYRLISVVYTPDGFVNEAMIQNGHGYYQKTGKDTGKEMVKAAEHARTNKLGVYSDHCTQLVNSENPKCTIKGNNREEKIYFLSDCGFYNQVQVQKSLGDEWFCNEKEAQKAGYRKTTQCL